MEDNKKTFLTMVLLILIICTYVLIGKNSDINQHMFFNNGFLTLPLIFLTTAYMAYKLPDKTVIKSHKLVIGCFLLFLFIFSLSSMLKSNESTFYYRASLDFIFIPKNTTFLGIYFSYPDLLKLFFFLSGYYVSQRTIIALINSLKKYAPKTITYVISYLISIILFVLIFVGLNNLLLLLINETVFNKMIINLTSYFIASLLTCLVSSLLFFLINLVFKPKKNLLNYFSK